MEVAERTGGMASDELRDINTILVATGLTQESVGAVVAALSVRELVGAELHAVNVIEPMSALEERAAPGLAEAHRKHAEEELSKFAKTHGLTGVATLHVESGEPEHEILHLRAQLKADMLVLGRYGKGGPKQGRLGSIAVRLARQCPVSTLIVKPEFRGMPGKVGVAVDLFSDQYIELERGIRIANRLGLDELLLLDAYQIPTGYHMVSSLEECRAKIETSAAERSAEIIRRMGAKFDTLPRITLKLAEGEPAPALATLVEQEGLELLVIGTQWRTPIAKMLLGRTSEKIINAVSCSVWAETSAHSYQGLIDGLKHLLD